MNQQAQIAEIEQLTRAERLRWFRRHAWVAFAAAQLPNMEPNYVAEEADLMLEELERRLDDETL